MLCHPSDAAEMFEERAHAETMCVTYAQTSTEKTHIPCSGFPRKRGMPDDQPVSARLKALRESAGLSVRALAEALEIPSSSYAAYEDGKRFKKPFIPVPFAHSLVRVLTPLGIDRADVLRLAGVEASNELAPSAEEMAEQLDAVLLPEVDVGYSMGGGAELSDFPVIQQVPFSRAWLSSLTNSSPSQLFVARGDGDSMMPTILDQDIVIIDRGQRMMRNQDRIWAIVYGGFGMIKRLRALPSGALQINSDNPAVSSIEATDGEAFIVGRVVAVVRRM